MRWFSPHCTAKEANSFDVVQFRPNANKTVPEVTPATTPGFISPHNLTVGNLDLCAVFHKVLFEHTLIPSPRGWFWFLSFPPPRTTNLFPGCWDIYTEDRCKF